MQKKTFLSRRVKDFRKKFLSLHSGYEYCNDKILFKYYLVGEYKRLSKYLAKNRNSLNYKEYIFLTDLMRSYLDLFIVKDHSYFLKQCRYSNGGIRKWIIFINKDWMLKINIFILDQTGEQLKI